MNFARKYIAAIIPVIISAVAIGISAWSLYLTSLKPANITVSVGEKFTLTHENEGLIFELPVVLHNAGTKPGVILAMGVILKDQNSEDAIYLKWQAFSQLIYDKEKKTFYNIDESNYTAATIPGNGDVAKMATFSGGESVATWIPRQSTYVLYLLAWTSETKHPSIRCKSTWTFDENTVLQIKNAVLQIRRNIIKKSQETIIRAKYGPNSKRLPTSQFNELVK